MLTFQDIILRLQNFWMKKECTLIQPFDLEMGAATFHPATALKAIGADLDPLLNKAKQSPPIPVSVGSITANTAAAEIAASMAFPPCFKMLIAVSDASGCDVATIALRE